MNAADSSPPAADPGTDLEASGPATGDRALGRLALRNGRRHLGRSLLIVALLAVPVAAAIVVAAGQRALFASAEDQRAWHYGQAEVVVQQGYMVPTGADPAEVDLEMIQQNTGLDETGAQRLLDWARDAEAGWLTDVIGRTFPGASVAVVERGGVGVAGGSIEVLGLDPTEPVTEGLVVLDDGHWPEADDQISLTPAAARFYEVAPGDEVDIDTLGSFTVSGIHRVRRDAQVRGVLVRPGRAPLGSASEYLVSGVAPGSPDAVIDGVFDETLIDALAADTGRDLAELMASAGLLYAAPASSFFGFDSDAPLRLDRPPVLAGFIAAALLIEVALVAAAAHAAGARRRLRELGLLATIGAAPGHIRRMVLMEAMVLGIVSVVLGVVSGLVATQLLEGPITDLPTHVVDGVSNQWGDLVAPALVGLVAAVAAAWWPARNAARVPVLAALSGRIPTRPLRFRAVPWSAGLLGVGLAIIAVGAATARLDATITDVVLVAMLGGCLLVLAGAALAGTWCVGRLAAHADRLPLTLRLVVRDAGRQQFRSAMAIAGLVVVLAAPVGVAAAVVTQEADSRAEFVANALDDEIMLVHPTAFGEEPGALPPTVMRSIDAVVPTRVAGTFQRLGGDSFMAAGFVTVEVSSDANIESIQAAFQVALGTPDAVEALRLGPRAQAILDDGRLVAVGAGSPEGPVALQSERAGAPEQLVVDAERVGDRAATWTAPGYLVPPDVAAELGLVPIDATTVLVTDAPLSDDARDALWRIGGGRDVGLSSGFFLQVGEPFDAFSVKVQAVALPIAAAVVIVIGACLVAIAATESDRDVATMLRVGAAPSLRRRFLGLQGWYHAALAAALAVPVGLLMLVALRRAAADPPPLVIPWVSTAVVLVAVPVVLGLVVAATVRSELPRSARLVTRSPGER